MISHDMKDRMCELSQYIFMLCYKNLNMQCELLEAAGEISIRATNVGTSPFAMRDVPLLSSSSFFAAVSAENSPSLGTSHPFLPYLPSHSA